MSKRFHRGLVVGKFAPLHRGHESVIDRAVAECDEVLLISYAHPEPAGCAPERRERWLAARFPQTRRLVVTDALLHSFPEDWPGPREVPPDSAPASIHRQFVGQLCLHTLGGPVEAVFTSEDYGDGFAAELTALFQRAVSGYPAVVHVLVDQARTAIPISGTALRADVHTHRTWLAPEVYASFVQRVVLLGGESSGKSTLAMAAAQALGTLSVAEYGRELWEQRAGQLSESDLPAIAHAQIRREEAALGHAHRWLFCDTSPLTTLLYFREMFGHAPQELEIMAQRHYHVTLLCAPDFPFVQDGTRRDAAFRKYQHEWYLRELTARGIPFTLISGPLEQRVRQIIATLAVVPAPPIAPA